MGKAIIAAISMFIISIIGASTAGELFFYYIVPSIIVGIIVGIGALLYSKIDNSGSNSNSTKNDFDELIKLRDIGLFNDAELEEAIELFENQSVTKEDQEQYKRCSDTLKELAEMGYFTNAEYISKRDELRSYFSMD